MIPRSERVSVMGEPSVPSIQNQLSSPVRPRRGLAAIVTGGNSTRAEQLPGELRTDGGGRGLGIAHTVVR